MAPIQKLPQTLINVPGVDKTRVGDEQLQATVREVEGRLGTTGRVLLRPSGTEPLVRVMIEAATQEQADQEAGVLAERVKELLSL